MSAAAAGPTPARWRTALRVGALAGIVVALVAIRVLTHVRTPGSDPGFQAYASAAPAAYLVPGLVLLRRRDWHVVGWLLCLLAMLFGFTFSTEVGVSAVRAGEAWLLWLLDVFEGPLWLLVTALLVVFPDGLGAQTVRQRRVGLFALAIAAAAVVPEPFKTHVTVSDAHGAMLPNPLPIAFVPPTIDDHTQFVAWGALLIALAALLLRYRASHAALRRQYRWVLWSLSFVVIGLVIGLAGSGLGGAAADLAWYPVLVAYAAVPGAFMVAILRYRLYEIDRLVSRTVTYTVVVVILAGVYSLAAALLTLVLPSGSNLAVASSTLAVAGAFRPLVGRVRRAVDRRFNRPRFDAEAEVERFARSLRDQTDLHVVTAQLRTAIDHTLHPDTVRLWIRPR